MPIVVPDFNYAIGPTAEDVEHKIRAANWWPSDPDQILEAQSQAEYQVNAAKARFLKLVRWPTFISDGQFQTRYYNHIAEGGIIRLGDGILELQSLTIQGREYVLNETFFALPENARLNDKPYTSLQLWLQGAHWQGEQFNRPRTLPPRSIKVVAKVGQYMEWPADAFEAILSHAAVKVLPSVNQESELAAISEDQYNETYDLAGPIDQKRALDEWGKDFYEVAASYARPKAGPQTLNVGASADRNLRTYFPLP